MNFIIQRVKPQKIILMMLVLSASSAVAQQSAGDRLAEIIHNEWEWRLREFPEYATYVGDQRYGDQLTDMSLAGIERRKRYLREVLTRLNGIAYDSLTSDEKLNFDLFRLEVSQNVEGQKFNSEYLQITQMDGIHSDIANLIQISRRSTVRDIEAIIARLGKLDRQIDQIIELLRRGLDQGITPPKIALPQVAGLIQAQLADDPAQSPVFKLTFEGLPADFPERDRLMAECKEVMATVVIPALRKLYEFWIGEYYPDSRVTIALSSLPNGPEWYRYNVKVYTTTGLTVEEIHRIGLREVERIRKQMQRVQEEAGYTGTLEEFFDFLREDDQFFFSRETELISAYRAIAKRIDPGLPKLFGTLPRLPYGVLPVPEYEARTRPAAHYMPGSLAAGRPGYFFANTYNLSARPKWEMEALTLHEAVPGHHLQISLGQELEGLPEFRLHGRYTAFVEGWALYAESLGTELGLYRDPYSRFGQLTFEMWRAMRLVVDTGMHALGWTRQQAIDYFKENSGKALHDIEVEVDRYIVWPGQALAYKIGQLRIQELRELSRRELGDRFDIRQYHDIVLGAGAIPLSVLESRVRAWIDGQR